MQLLLQWRRSRPRSAHFRKATTSYLGFGARRVDARGAVVVACSPSKFGTTFEEKLRKVESDSPSSSTTNVREDALSQVLGRDKPGRLRGMGGGVTISKLSFSQARDKHVIQLEENQTQLYSKINHLTSLVHTLIGRHQIMPNEEAANEQNELWVDKASPGSTNHKFLDKCKLLDWCKAEYIVVEGRWCSSDPNELVNQIPLGPNAIKVMVDIPNKPEAFLWRPIIDMSFIQQAEGKTIAWPTYKSVNNNKTLKKCNLLDFSGSGKIVAKGHWSSSNPNDLVHFVPLGPNAMRVWVDIPRIPTASLWRPTSDFHCIEDAIGTTIAWPSDKVVML